MKIYYVANSRMPTIKAYGLQIVKMCEAFTKIGFDCELIVPKRHRYPNTGEGNILEYYNVKTPFRVTELKSPDLINIDLGSFLNKMLFWIQQYFFALALKKYLRGKDGIIYSRDQFALGLADSGKFKLFWEAHNFPKNIDSRFYKKILGKLNGLVVISEGLKNDFTGYYRGPVLVAPDGVDLEEFDVKTNKEEARKKLNLPLDKKIAVYTGHLYSWKGVDVLNAILEYLDDNEMILIVGGTKKDQDIFQRKIPTELLDKVQLTGHVPHEIIPYYLKAADCAVLTGKRSESISEKYTSPLKMFEYMASGCPIVTQDLPSFREVLNERNSFLVEPENAKKLADKIAWVFENEELAKEKAAKAFEDVQKYTWLERAKKIANIISA